MKYDLVLVGGGLANGLIAVRLLSRRPELKIAIVEAGDRLGGNHTWSFHGTDITGAQWRWIEPLVGHSWTSHEVRFDGAPRVFSGSYHAIESARLDDRLRALPGLDILVNRTVVDIAPTSAVTADGTRLRARAVIDGRGQSDSRHLVLGYQKFLGLEVRLRRPHGLRHPILMDGTVQQVDGYRFVYVLPFAEDRLLIEDTYYSDKPAVDATLLTARIHAYADDNGWEIDAVERCEYGVLPIVLAGDIDAYWREADDGVARVGMRAALFHPTTGYSLPDAVRLADAIAAADDLEPGPLAALTRNLSCGQWHRRGFYRLVNRLLFLASDPSQRMTVMARFYRLSPGLIERFYSGQTTAADKVRILTGRPPISLTRALRVVSPRAAYGYRA